jgi:hypothetical protein
MNGPSKKGIDGDSYAVWRALIVINLRAKRLLSIVTGNDNDDDFDDDEIQPPFQRRQARVAHIMTSALGTGPFLFVQGVNNDPATILRILDTKYQGTDTSSVMSAVNEFTTKKHRPGQHMEMFVAEFEGLAMRLEAIGNGVSERMRVVNFLNSLSEVSPLSAVLSALRFIDNLSWIKATTQILFESELKGVNNNGPERSERAMVASNGFTGTCYTCGEVDHRSSDHIDRGRHQSRHPWVVMEGTVEDITLIVAKEIITLIIVKVTEVRAQEVCAKEARATKKTSMDVAVFCRPDQCSLTNSYVDDNSCLISE